MKLKDISSLNLSKKSLDDIEVDVTELISHDEFNKNILSKNGYRIDAIDRLRKNKLPFHTTCNLAYEIIKKFVNIDCPYCGAKMEIDGGGGSGTHSSADFKCRNCKAAAQLTIDNSSGLSFQAENED